MSVSAVLPSEEEKQDTDEGSLKARHGTALPLAAALSCSCLLLQELFQQFGTVTSVAVMKECCEDDNSTSSVTSFG